MFSSLVSFLEQRFGPGGGSAPVPRDELRIAVAALLVEMVRADFDEGGEELTRARALLTHRYGLDAQDAERLLDAARREADHTVSLFRFTHLVNQHLEMPDKLTLMSMLWEVAYADGSLDKHEDALMHKLADLMYVPLRDLMRLKEAAREKSRER
ncbi:MAG TPA: TerB family tellurite resistance protein [Gammaproteobacteria bacterium]